jgi:Flp pilus assembly protein TadG
MIRRPTPRTEIVPRAGRDNGGFAALELAILFPFVIVMLLLVVGFGRVSRGRELVDQAAQAAARAGSLTTSPGAARDAATQAAQQTLTDGGLSCTDVQVTVNTAAFRPGGQVDAHVTCTADLSGLTLSGVPGHIALTADSVSPLEPYRPLGTGSSP